MRSEYSANLSLVQDAEQNHLPQHQVAAANKAQRQSTAVDSSWFWVRAIKFITAVTVLAVTYRLFIIWWG